MTARRGLVVVTFIAVVLLMASAASAAKGGWPKKSGELCWVADASGELSLVIAQITNMGNDHYLFHGQAYRVDENNDPLLGYEIQPFSGNAEIDGGLVIGQITKLEINPPNLESYSGIFMLDLGTLVGDVEGIISQCTLGGADPCDDQINTGLIPLMPVLCP